jgi:hypothetical protein
MMKSASEEECHESRDLRKSNGVSILWGDENLLGDW